MGCKRRSLFPTDKDRGAFLGRVMTGIRSLLSNQTGFAHQDNYHQFCRLLGRLKANYQLSELVKADGYLEWLEQASNFTVQSIRNWQGTNCIDALRRCSHGVLVKIENPIKLESVRTRKPDEKTY